MIRKIKDLTWELKIRNTYFIIDGCQTLPFFYLEVPIVLILLSVVEIF